MRSGGLQVSMDRDELSLIRNYPRVQRLQGISPAGCRIANTLFGDNGAARMPQPNIIKE